MSFAELGALGELIGAIAVVISLVYLALQLRHNTRALKASATWEAETMWGKLNYENANNPSFAKLLLVLFDENAEPTQLTEDESAQVQFLVRSLLQFQQAQYLLWRDGTLPGEYYETRKQWTQWFIRLPLVAPVLAFERTQPGVLYDEFYDFITQEPVTNGD